MEGEMNNFIVVWATVLASLCYCHTVAKFFPAKGTTTTTRRLAILPISCLFFYLPLNLTSIHLGGTTSFFIAWLASFKLILFAFGKGPLSTNPPIPLSRFIPLACLPIKYYYQQSSEQESTKKNKKSFRHCVLKLMLVVMCIRIYGYMELIHRKIIWFIYALHIYFMLEMLLLGIGEMARALVRIELERPFDEPYLSTSLQDFWGRRWNLMASNILRPTVYDPVRSISGRWIGKNLAAIPAVKATFLVSGLMHELVFYNIGRLKPTGEVTSFFLLHGFSLAAEMAVKRALKGKLRVPGLISGPLTIGFVVYTSFLLFFPPLLRGKADLKACTESLAFIEFVKHQRLASPANFTCPFL